MEYFFLNLQFIETACKVKLKFYIKESYIGRWTILSLWFLGAYMVLHKHRKSLLTLLIFPYSDL